MNAINYGSLTENQKNDEIRNERAELEEEQVWFSPCLSFFV